MVSAAMTQRSGYRYPTSRALASANRMTCSSGDSALTKSSSIRLWITSKSNPNCFNISYRRGDFEARINRLPILKKLKEFYRIVKVEMVNILFIKGYSWNRGEANFPAIHAYSLALL